MSACLRGKNLQSGFFPTENTRCGLNIYWLFPAGTYCLDEGTWTWKRGKPLWGDNLSSYRLQINSAAYGGGNQPPARSDFRIFNIRYERTVLIPTCYDPSSFIIVVWGACHETFLVYWSVSKPADNCRLHLNISWVLPKGVMIYVHCKLWSAAFFPATGHDFSPCYKLLVYTQSMTAVGSMNKNKLPWVNIQTTPLAARTSIFISSMIKQDCF